MKIAVYCVGIACINIKSLNIPVKDTIYGQYIVHLKAGTPYRIMDSHIDEVKDNFEKDDSINYIYYNKAFQGYSGKFSPKLLSKIRTLDEVEFVEQDIILKATNITTQEQVPWGLARVSNRNKLVLDTYDEYSYDNRAGEGVTAFVLDTGVFIEHEDFEGRATWGTTTPKHDVDKDMNGHGTHCSGTIGGKKYGISKKVKLVAVKVLNSKGYGSNSEVIKGIDWMIKHDTNLRYLQMINKQLYKGSVANMSLGGSNSKALDRVVNAAVERGIHFGVAAGNENGDACLSSPASASKAITVGASTINDERAYFSNYGKCVDIFAPGLYIKSAWIGNHDSTNVISGTSMATPHTVGLMAYFLSIVDNPLSHEEMRDLLLYHSSKGLIKDIKDDTPNFLIYNGVK